MDGTDGTNQTSGAQPGDSGFGPREASELLGQSTRQARRGFNPNPPLLSLIRAVLVLAGYGALWLSVRGQHPYRGPSGWAIALVYTLVFVVIGTTAAATRRASAGVSRGSPGQRRAEITVLAVAWIAVYVFMGALSSAGASHVIVYGLYPATAPLMIVGLVGAAGAAARADWPALAVTLPVAAVAAVAGYAGPIAAWLIMGVGLAAALLASAAATAWLQRA